MDLLGPDPLLRSFELHLYAENRSVRTVTPTSLRCGRPTVSCAAAVPAKGHKRWTLRLLADRLVELQVVESVSYETVRQVLQQTGSSRG
jgi:hypothetical protein